MTTHDYPGLQAREGSGGHPGSDRQCLPILPQPGAGEYLHPGI